MTAVPPPVPPEIVRRAAKLNYTHGIEAAIAAVYGDIVEAARRDRDAEIKRLRAAVAELREQIGGDCIGCNHNDGPDECCPMHGRTLVDWMEIADRVIGRENDLHAELEADRERAVEAARRDALESAVAAIRAAAAEWADVDPYDSAPDALADALRVVTDLRDATAPRTAPNATVSDQDAVPRTPGTNEAQIGVQSDD